MGRLGAAHLRRSPQQTLVRHLTWGVAMAKAPVGTAGRGRVRSQDEQVVSGDRAFEAEVADPAQAAVSVRAEVADEHGVGAGVKM